MPKPQLLSKIKLDPQELLKQIDELRKENDFLKKEVVSLQQPTESPEELMCIEQIALLKAKSSAMELTLEETKKVETYVKVLQSIRSRSKKPKDDAENLDLDQLLNTVS